MQNNLPYAKAAVDDIITNQITAPEKIEPTLDFLLGYVSLGRGNEEFERLIKYYESVHGNHADFYWFEYRDLRGLE